MLALKLEALALDQDIKEDTKDIFATRDWQFFNDFDSKSCLHLIRTGGSLLCFHVCGVETEISGCKGRSWSILSRWGETFGWVFWWFEYQTPKCPNWSRSELNPAGNRETEDAFEVELQVWRGFSKGSFLKNQKNLTCWKYKDVALQHILFPQGTSSASASPNKVGDEGEVFIRRIDYWSQSQMGGQT